MTDLMGRQHAEEVERFFGALRGRLAKVRDAETHDYQRFFDTLAPLLESARALEQELDAKLARRFNALDYLRTDELGLSRIIADLLDPGGKHGQGALFLKRLLEGLQCFTTPGRLDQARVVVEKKIKDDRRLDICIYIDEGCCLAIENKPYSGDQEDQVNDYLNWLRKYRQSLLIYLSPQGEPPSSDSIALECLRDLQAGQLFKIMPYCSAPEVAWEDGFDDYRTGRSLTEWLSDWREHCDVDRLRWFLREAEDFCKRAFGEPTMASKEMETIKEFVLSDKRNTSTALAVYQSWPKIQCAVFEEFFETIWNKMNFGKELVDFYYEYDCSESKLKSKSYFEMYRNSWQECKKASEKISCGGCTRLRLEATGPGPNNLFIGVLSPNAEFTPKEKKRRKELEIKLFDALGPGESSWDGWLWWEWIDEKYKDWDPLLCDIHQECMNNGGEITEYFAKKFDAMAEATDTHYRRN